MNRRIELHGKTFTIIAKPEEHHVDYQIHEEDSNGTPLIDGSVKWDGCSNWGFPSTETCMFHGCTRGDLLAFGELMAICRDMTLDLCVKADPSLFNSNGRDVS